MKIDWKRIFITISLVTLLFQMINAVITIVLSMPAQVIIGDSILAPSEATPATVAKEFVLQGTALAPPLIQVIVFAIMSVLVRRTGGWSIFGTIILILQGILFTLASFGEYANPDRFALMPGYIHIVILFIFNLFTAALAVTGVLTLITYKKNKSPANQNLSSNH